MPRWATPRPSSQWRWVDGPQPWRKKYSKNNLLLDIFHDAYDHWWFTRQDIYFLVISNITWPNKCTLNIYRSIHTEYICFFIVYPCFPERLLSPQGLDWVYIFWCWILNQVCLVYQFVLLHIFNTSFCLMPVASCLFLIFVSWLAWSYIRSAQLPVQYIEIRRWFLYGNLFCKWYINQTYNSSPTDWATVGPHFSCTSVF